MLHLKSHCKTVLSNIFLSNRIVINVPNFCSYSSLSLQCENILSFNYYIMMYSVVSTYITEGDSNDIAI